MYTALEIADYVLDYYNFEKNKWISNQRLQYTIYFVQAEYLVVTKNALFSEDFEAWPSGPTLPAVYIRYQKFGASSIPIIYEKKKKSRIKKEDAEIINNILDELMNYTDSSLSKIVVNQKPWIDTYHDSIWWKKEYDQKAGIIVYKKRIPKGLIYEFFNPN